MYATTSDFPLHVFILEINIIHRVKYEMFRVKVPFYQTVLWLHHLVALRPTTFVNILVRCAGRPPPLARN